MVHHHRVILVDLVLKNADGKMDTSWVISGTRKKASSGHTAVSHPSTISSSKPISINLPQVNLNFFYSFLFLQRKIILQWEILSFYIIYDDDEIKHKTRALIAQFNFFLNFILQWRHGNLPVQCAARGRGITQGLAG